MSATVCPINPPGHDWQNGLTCNWCRTTRTVTEAILSQLSSRRGGTPADARKLLDAYRAEVLTEATTTGEAYPGELAMLHGLIATLTAVAQHGDLNDVRKLLEEHKADDAQARTETSSHEHRVAALLAAIRLHRGAWNVRRVQEWRRFTGGPTQRGTARRDLDELHRRGHLHRHGQADGRFYTLNPRKDHTP